jgi:hypothetical protein
VYNNVVTNIKPIADILPGKVGTFTPSASHTAPIGSITSDGHCYVATSTKGFNYTVGGEIVVPQDGSIGGGGLVTSNFFYGVLQHEGWHSTIFRSFAASVYAALESWTAGYTSNKFSSPQAASSAWQTDMNKALGVVNSFATKYASDSLLNHPADATVANGLWTLGNSNWGGDANALVQAYNPTFSKTKGDCE